MPPRPLPAVPGVVGPAADDGNDGIGAPDA